MSKIGKVKLDIFIFVVTMDNGRLNKAKDKIKNRKRKNMNKFVLRQSLLLLLAATIWGTAFVAQSVGMEYVGPFTFTATRNFVGCIVLLPFIFFMDKSGKREINKSINKKISKPLILGGLLTGIALCIASNLQQYGIMYTSVGKSGFITAMYIVLVPIFGIVIGRKQSLRMWIAILVAVAGLYFLCMTTGNYSIQIGDVLLLLCVVSFSIQILLVDHFSPLVNGVKLAWVQFFVCGVLSAVLMFIYEQPTISGIVSGWSSILYAGALSTGVAYTIQVIAQKGMNPAVASLIMSMESVISVIAGWLILNQKLSKRELIGCGLMFAAIILVQLPERNKQN